MSAACVWCGESFDPSRRDAVFCGRRCRQAAWRFEQRRQTDERDALPMRIAYADPPYPGYAEPLYGMPEVDHAELVSSLQGFDGWALSTHARSLRDVLPLCPAAVRVCAWCKPIGVSRHTRGLHSTWEPLIVKPARMLRPGKRDWLRAMPARGGGTLVGRKPPAFVAFLFEALGALPGDELEDLFPGTGIVGRAWRYVCARGEALPAAELGPLFEGGAP